MTTKPWGALQKQNEVFTALATTAPEVSEGKRFKSDHKRAMGRLASMEGPTPASSGCEPVRARGDAAESTTERDRSPRRQGGPGEEADASEPRVVQEHSTTTAQHPAPTIVKLVAAAACAPTAEGSAVAAFRVEGAWAIDATVVAAVGIAILLLVLSTLWWRVRAQARLPPSSGCEPVRAGGGVTTQEDSPAAPTPPTAVPAPMAAARYREPRGVVCTTCGRRGQHETLPFEQCYTCGEAPACHHGRCCPQATAVPGTIQNWTVQVTRAMAGRGWPAYRPGQVRQMKAVARRLQIRCPGCSGAEYSTTGSNQFYLRLKCARCETLLANPRVPRSLG